MSKLLNRAVLALQAFCGPTEEFPRYRGLDSILIGPEKATATDGRIMAEVSLPDLDSKDFPSAGNYTVANEFEPFLLFRAAATKVLKMLPKKQSSPVLECAAVLLVADDKVGLVTTDLETMSPTIVGRPKGNFPATDPVWPVGEPSVEIRVSALLLKRACDYVAEFGEHVNRSMALSIYPATAGEGVRMVKVGAALESGQTFRALIMPLDKRN